MSSPNSKCIDVLLNPGIKSLMVLLNSIVAGLGSPGPTGAYLICNKARLTSVLVSKYLSLFSYRCYTTSTCALLWWWYDDTFCQVFNFQEKSEISLKWYYCQHLSLSSYKASILKYSFMACDYAICWWLFSALYYWEFTVVIYNTRKVAFVNCE